MKKMMFGNSLLLTALVIIELTMGTAAIYAGIATAIAGLAMSVAGFSEKG